MNFCLLCRVYTSATSCAQQAARNLMLVARNLLHVARNKLRATRNLLRATSIMLRAASCLLPATSCAGVNATIDPLVHFAPYLVVHWVTIWTIGGPQVWCNERGCLPFKKFDYVACAVRWSTVLLQVEKVSRDLLV